MDTHVDSAPVVVCAGLLTLDVVHTLPRMPSADEKLTGTRQRLSVGGPAATAAAVAAALGARVTLVAPFGRSPVRGLVARDLAASGVTWIDPAADLTNPAPLSSVLVLPDGSRAVVSGGAPPLPEPLEPDPVLEIALDAASAVLVDGHAMSLCHQVAAAAHARGVPVVLDGGSHKPGTAALLADVDLAVVSADFRAPAGQEPLAWLLGQGARYAAQTRGALPVVAAVGEAGGTVADTAAGVGRHTGERWETTVPTVEMHDTLGAGDVFHGAAVWGVARLGCSDGTVARVLEYAAALASLSCAHEGALGWLADAEARRRAHELSVGLVHGGSGPARAGSAVGGASEAGSEGVGGAGGAAGG